MHHQWLSSDSNFIYFQSSILNSLSFILINFLRYIFAFFQDRTQLPFSSDFGEGYFTEFILYWHLRYWEIYSPLCFDCLRISIEFFFMLEKKIDACRNFWEEIEGFFFWIFIFSWNAVCEISNSICTFLVFSSTVFILLEIENSVIDFQIVSLKIFVGLY